MKAGSSPMSRRKVLPTTHRLRKGPDFANSSRFHSAPFQRRPVNRSTGPRFHSAPLHRLKSSKTGCPGAMSAAVSPSPISRQAAHQGLAETSALTTPPTSVRPLPLRASRWPYACPPPARRRPPSHPAVRSRHNAAPRPVDGHNIDKLRAGVAQGVQSVTFAQHRFAVTVRPIFGNPASHPENGSPPSGMKSPTRLL